MRLRRIRLRHAVVAVAALMVFGSGAPTLAIEPDTNVRYKNIRALNANDNTERDKLFAALNSEVWHVRGGAIEVLANASGDALEDLTKTLKRSSKVWVREGIAWALGRRADEAGVEPLIEALDDKQFVVRRAVALSLAKVPTKQAVPELIAAWKKDKDDRMAVFYKQALETITGEDIGWHPEDWHNWFKGAGDGFVPKKKGKDDKQDGDGKAGSQPPTKKEKKTVLRDVELTFTESGEGGPLFVLPDYGFNKDYMRASLKGLEGVARVFYIDLPTLANFKNLQAVGGTGMPYYPIDKLCDAFDELRKQRKQKRIAILGHGLSGWVGMRYATKYPEHVSHLILVSSWSSGESWNRGRSRVESDGKRRGDLEQEHFAQSLLIDMQSGQPQYQAKDQAESMALMRMSWTAYFNDIRHGAAWMYYPTLFREMGQCLIPMDFNIAKEKKSPVPTLLLFGSSKRTLWTAQPDQRMMRKAYPNAQLVPCPNSNRLPMIEDNELFLKATKSFFRKYKFRSRVKS